jgi:hypothetical protein
VGTLANRYRGQGVNYEIENEVNAGVFWKGTQEEYLELLKAGYDVIKKADPSAKVLPSAMGCGILQNFQSGWVGEKAWKWHDGWLRPILSSKKFDAVNVHNYYFPSGITANGLTFRSYLDHIHDLMKESGLGAHPIWITETGFVSLPADASGRMDCAGANKNGVGTLPQRHFDLLHGCFCFAPCTYRFRCGRHRIRLRRVTRRIDLLGCCNFLPALISLQQDLDDRIIAHETLRNGILYCCPITSCI